MNRVSVFAMLIEKIPIRLCNQDLTIIEPAKLSQERCLFQFPNRSIRYDLLNGAFNGRVIELVSRHDGAMVCEFIDNFRPMFFISLQYGSRDLLYRFRLRLVKPASAFQ